VTNLFLDKPLIGEVPQGRWETLTLVAGLRCDGVIPPLVIKGAMDGSTFIAYVAQALVPKLKCTQIVIVDNLQAHKVARQRT
jgi:transposase